MIKLFGENYGRKFGWFPFRERKEECTEVLKSFRKKTEKNELAHLFILVLLIALSINLIINGETAEAVVVIFINIPFNLYPIMLQRYLRFRVERLIMP